MVNYRHVCDITGRFCNYIYMLYFLFLYRGVPDCFINIVDSDRVLIHSRFSVRVCACVWCSLRSKLFRRYELCSWRRRHSALCSVSHPVSHAPVCVLRHSFYCHGSHGFSRQHTFTEKSASNTRAPIVDSFSPAALPCPVRDFQTSVRSVAVQRIKCLFGFCFMSFEFTNISVN